MTSSEQFKIYILDKWREMKESRATNIIVLKSKHNRKKRSRSIVLARRRQQFWNTHSCSRQDVAREERKQFSVGLGTLTSYYVGSSPQECWTKNLIGGVWDKRLWTLVLCSSILGVSVACSSFWNSLSTISPSLLQDYTLFLSAPLIEPVAILCGKLCISNLGWRVKLNLPCSLARCFWRNTSKPLWLWECYCWWL